MLYDIIKQMEFDLQNMVLTLKDINNQMTNADFFYNFIDSMIYDLDLNKNGENLHINETRISKIMNKNEQLYASLCKAVINNEDKAKASIYNRFNDKINEILGEIPFDRVIARLEELMENDPSFDAETKNKIKNEELNQEEIFAEFIIYAIKIEDKRRKYFTKYKLASGNFVTKKADSSLCSLLIEQIINNVKINKSSIKHELPWTLEAKLEKNKIHPIMQGKIKDVFYQDYETVMQAIDNLEEVIPFAAKSLYNYYFSTYYSILDELFKNKIDEDKIIDKSTEIFNEVNKRIYNKFFDGKLKIEEELVEYNLFAITVVVFYKCKFLITVDGEEKWL